MSNTNDRRNNWKETISQEAQARTQKRLTLLDELDTIREQMRRCGTDFTRRDALSLTYRETVAKLATL